jgi:hypothetical protein
MSSLKSECLKTLSGCPYDPPEFLKGPRGSLQTPTRCPQTIRGLVGQIQVGTVVFLFLDADRESVAFSRRTPAEPTGRGFGN